MKLSSYLQKHYAPSTALVYQRLIYVYLAHNPKATAYNYAQIISYIGTLRQVYNNQRTIQIRLQSIKVYYQYLCHNHQRKDNPAAAIVLKDKISKDIQLQDLFTTAELEHLLLAKKERSKTMVIRNRVLLSLLIYQALKPSEIAALEISHIQLEKVSIYIKASYLCNARTLALNAHQILLFKDYLEKIRPQLLRGNTSSFFIIGSRALALKERDISKHIQTYYQLYPNRVVNCKTIRQSVITNLLKQGHDLAIVQSFAGHKNPSSTEKYQQQKVEALQQALNLYHPFV
jgi:integrase/recombinase XerD